MVNIQVLGPTHSRKGYIMLEIARVLREHGCTVHLQGEETHLAEKVSLDANTIDEKLAGQEVRITELQTGV